MFGNIEDIVTTSHNICLFVLNTYVVNRYNKHYNAYEIDALDEIVVCQHQDLADHHLLCINKSYDRTLCTKNFVCLKYHVL